MAADVSSFFSFMNSGDGPDPGKSTAPITRDLLGGYGRDTQELDLELQVPSGWEKRLDLKSGRIYLQRCTSSSNSSPKRSSLTSENHKNQTSKSSMDSFRQDLNLFPPRQQALTLLDDAVLDLKLVSTSPAAGPPSPASNYRSVCTLDKVKSALERETGRKRGRSTMSAAVTSSSNSSSSVRDGTGDRSPASSFAAGCPHCLMYVLVAGNHPKCPRCGGDVPSPPVMAAPEKPKLPRIDLNIAI